MTLEPWMIYLVFVADKIVVVSATALSALLLLGCASAFSILVFHDIFDEGKENIGLTFCKRHLKTWTISLVIAVAIPVFVPNSKVLAAMYVLPPIINSAAVQELPAELVELARAYIKDTIGNLKEKGE